MKTCTLNPEIKNRFSGNQNAALLEKIHGTTQADVLAQEVLPYTHGRRRTALIRQINAMKASNQIAQPHHQ